MFSSRKKAPKRVAREEPAAQDIQEEDGPAVRRPTVPRNKSKLRISFNPGETAVGKDEENTPRVKPSRLGPSSTSQTLPRFESDTEVSRPSYTKSSLDELRNSTPSTPKELTTYDPSPPETNQTSLDIASKFGSSSIIQPTSSIIPSAAEIQEKKDRRARLALQSTAQKLEDDFIPLESYDSDGEFRPQRLQLSTFHEPESHAKEDTRLVRDDEDLMEGFDTFVDDPGRVLPTTSKKAQRDQAQRDREALRSLIEDAQSSASESDSEAERNHAYESAQTHRGMDGLALHDIQTRKANRPRQPREMTPIPKLAVALGRLREAVQRIELERVKIERRRADIRREKAEIRGSQEHIQRSLEEAGRELEKLREKEIGRGENGLSEMAAAGSERGLESFGNVSTKLDEEMTG